ncbi:hypothetical protein ACSSS7_000109 [Eimeria intestinalis]
MANLSEHRQFATKLRRERALSEAAFKNEAPDAAPAVAWPSTPQNARRAGQGWSVCTDGRASTRVKLAQTSIPPAMEGQLPSAFHPGDRTEGVGRTQVMRGVITGPARWRNGAASHGTPVLYCAVYRYHTPFARAFEEAPAASTLGSQNAGGLPPPELLSSSWGQGPLVIEGVPVPEKRTNVEDVVGSHHLTHVLAVGVFRNSSGAHAPEASLCGGGSSPLQKNWLTLPRPDELLGALYVPLHCVHLTESQQEVKLRLPVLSPQPASRSPAECAAFVKDERESELAAVLSPACSLENLEAIFKRGLTASTTGINRCNVMLFRLSGSTESFLTSSDTLLRAAIAAPLTPSMASTARQPVSNALHHHSSEAVAKSQDKCFPTDLNDTKAGMGAAVAGEDGAPISSSVGDPAKPAECGPYGCGVCEGRTASRHGSCRPVVLQSPTNSTPTLFTQERQRQRQQQRQQELSVAAVLAASAIAAAARGERDRSARSSVSRQPSEPGKFLEGSDHKNPRPSSACSLVHNKGSSSLPLRSLMHARSDALASLAALPNRPQQAAREQRSLDVVGELDVSPDDSVSVRGEDAQLLAAAMLSRAGGSTNDLLPSGLRGRLGTLAADEPRFDCIPDDRKSTLSTSIRRLDCLMTRAQLLLSQRRHSQQHRDNHHALNSNVRSEQKNPPDARTDFPGRISELQEGTQEATREEDVRRPGDEGGRSGPPPSEEMNAKASPAAVGGSVTSSHLGAPAASPACCLQVQAASLKASKDIFIARALRTVTAIARRPTHVLTQKFIFRTWLQETRWISQQRRAAGLRMAAACASVACHAALKRQQLQVGWVALKARARVEERKALDDARDAEARGAMVEDIRQQVNEKDSYCQLLERRVTEERLRHAQELASLRERVVQLDEQLKGSRKEGELCRSSDGQETEDRERLRQQLGHSLEECRDLKLLVADHAAAKARSDEECKRLQSELALSQQRTKDLEQQLALVDEQLVGILQRTVPRAPLQHQHERGVEAVGPWAIQQLQCMRDALKDVQQKRPLVSSTDARRQPPAETELPTPLRRMSRDTSLANNRGAAPPIPRVDRQGEPVTTGSVGRPPLQPHSTTAMEETPKDCKAPLQPQLLPASPPTSQPGRTQYMETFEASGRPCARTPQRVGRGGRQAGDAYPPALVSKVSELSGNLQHNRFFPMPHGSSARSQQQHARSQQVREQLDRQRTHRQQLLQMGVHPVQQMQGAPPASHLHTSFIAPVVRGRLQSPAATYVACPLPAQPLQQANQQHLCTQLQMRTPSPLQHAHAARSRLQARCGAHSVT